MNARAAQGGYARRGALIPTDIPDEPITEPPCPDDDTRRCPYHLPGCPTVRCQRPIHPGQGMCHAVGRNPYWAAYWETTR